MRHLLSLLIAATIVLAGCNPSRTCGTDQGNLAGRGEAASPPPVSPYARAVFEALRGENLEALSADWPSEVEPPKAPSGHLEWHDLRPQLGMDLPRQTLLIDPDTGQFWIMLWGGYLGLMEWRGPATLTDNRAVPLAPPP